MTNEEKQLLLKDLCARLPYNVVVRCTDSDTDYNCFLTTDILHEIQNGYEYYDYKPYLRPMSSMTEEERRELRILWYEDFAGDSSLSPESLGILAVFPCHPKTTDFYLSHHFDYRGLIEKGLALEAPDDMYKQ